MGSSSEAWSTGYDGQSYGDAAVGWQHQHQHQQQDQHQLGGQVPLWAQQANSQMPNSHYMPNRHQQQQQQYRQYQQQHRQQAHGMGRGRPSMNDDLHYDHQHHHQHHMEEYWTHAEDGGAEASVWSGSHSSLSPAAYGAMLAKVQARASTDSGNPSTPVPFQETTTPSIGADSCAISSPDSQRKDSQKNGNNNNKISNKINRCNAAPSSASEEGTASTEQPTPQPTEAPPSSSSSASRKNTKSSKKLTAAAAAVAGPRRLSSPEEIQEREAREAAQLKEKMEASLAKYFNDDGSSDEDEDKDEEDEDEEEDSQEENEEESEDECDQENEPEAEHGLDGNGASNPEDTPEAEEEEEEEETLRTILFPDQHEQHYQGSASEFALSLSLSSQQQQQQQHQQEDFEEWVSPHMQQQWFMQQQQQQHQYHQQQPLLQSLQQGPFWQHQASQPGSSYHPTGNSASAAAAASIIFDSFVGAAAKAKAKAKTKAKAKAAAGGPVFPSGGGGGGAPMAASSASISASTSSKANTASASTTRTNPTTTTTTTTSSSSSSAAIAAAIAAGRPSPESPLSLAELANGARLGNIFADKLQQLPLPDLEDHLPSLFDIMHRCLKDLYDQKVTPTVIAMQNQLESQGASPNVVQAVLPICARKKRLFQIFVPKDCNTCILLVSESLEKAALRKATYSANYRPEFLDALREVLQAKAAGKGIQAPDREKWSPLPTTSTAAPAESQTHLSLSTLL